MLTKIETAFACGDGGSPVRHGLEQRLAYVEKLVADGGPEPSGYAAFTGWLDEVAAELGAGLLTDEDLDLLRRAFGRALSPDTLQGHSYSKPHGYSGDYEIIDRIYRRHLSSDASLRNWDLYCHAQSGPSAVRNRKGYFVELLRRLEAALPDGVERPVLNVASGPCRDLREYFDGSHRPGSALTFDCVDSDPEAIAYAAALCRPYLDRIEFHRANALRFRSPQPYRLIWSAGLFDYLGDRHFAFLLGQLLAMLDADGELVIGNFSTDNPTRPYMEIVGDWHLHHRSPEELVALACSCGVAEADVRVGREPEGVNLFLHIKRGADFL